MGDNLAQTTTAYHFAIGITGQASIGQFGYEGPYVDLPVNFLTSPPRSSSGPNTSIGSIYSYPTAFVAAAFTQAGTASSFESAVLLETQASVSGMTAASTVMLVDANMNPLYSGSLGNTYLADGTSSAGCTTFTSSIESAIHLHYGTTDYGNVVSAVLPSGSCGGGDLVLIPQNGLLNVGLWSGAGYTEIIPSSTGLQLIDKISGGLSGGFPGTNIPDPAPNTQVTLIPPASTSTMSSLLADIPSPSNPQFLEPVDGITGSYVYQHTDLVTGGGSFPYALPFARTYQSASGSNLTTTVADAGMGNGWAHGYNMSALVQSDPYIGMGSSDSPAISAATSIAALYVIQDLNSITPTARTMTVAWMATHWFTDYLTGNTVMVTRPNTTEEFVALPYNDGSTNISYTAPTGSSVQLSEVSSGQYAYRMKDGETLNFGPTPTGALQSWVFPNGMSVNLTYTGSLLSGVTNNLGRSLALSYTGTDVTRVTDDTGRQTNYAYDGNHNLLQFTDPLGSATVFAYDISGTYDTAAHLTQIFYPSHPGNAFVTNWYDPLGHVNQQANGNGNITNFYFAGSRSELVDPLSERHVTYQTDRGKVLNDVWVLSSGFGDVFYTTAQLNGSVNVTTNQYDGLDRLTLTTLPESGTISYAYATAINPWANNVSSIEMTPKSGSPLSPVTTTFTYDPIYNKPTSITDPLGLVSTLNYDPATGNLLTSVADAGSTPHFQATTNFTYNGVGQVLTVTDPLGVVTQFAYDGFGNQTSITRDYGGSGHLNQLTTIGYDSSGDATSVTDPNTNVTQSGFDTDRRLTSVTTPSVPSAPGGLTTAFSYDPDGRVLQTQQSNGGTVLRTTTATYTLTGEIATTTDANGNITQYAYDAVDRLASLTDPLFNVTSYAYDAMSSANKRDQYGDPIDASFAKGLYA